MLRSEIITILLLTVLASFGASAFAPLPHRQAWGASRHVVSSSSSSSSLQMSGAADAADTEGEKTGTVKWFNPRVGYGFIAPDDGSGEDLYAHQSKIKMGGFRKLVQDEKVRYHVKMDEKRGKPFAYDIVRLALTEEREDVVADPVMEKEQELEAAAEEAALAEVQAVIVAEEAERVAEQIDAAEHSDTVMTLAEAAEVAEVEAARKDEEEKQAEAEKVAAEAIAKKLEEEKATAEAKKVVAASASAKKADDPLSQLKNFFGF